MPSESTWQLPLFPYLWCPTFLERAETHQLCCWKENIQLCTVPLHLAVGHFSHSISRTRIVGIDYFVEILGEELPLQENLPNRIKSQNILIDFGLLIVDVQRLGYILGLPHPEQHFVGLSDTIRNGNCFDDLLDDFMDFRDSPLHLLDDDFLNNLLNNNRFLDGVCLLYDLYLGDFNILDDFLFDSESVTNLIRVGLVNESLEECTEAFLLKALLEYLVLHIMIFKLRKSLPEQRFEFKLMVLVLERFESCRNTTEPSLIESYIVIM